MIFSDLYGEELTRELGTADVVQRFTTVRRKAAINAAQREFVTKTRCLTKQVSVTLADSTQEYDLDSLIQDVYELDDQDVSVVIVSGSTTRYLEGDDLAQTSIARLDVEEPGWRASPASSPIARYLRKDGGRWYLGLHPKPSITGSDVWTAVIGALIVPADLTADSDEPFTVSGNPLKMLRPYHRALPHFAAYDLEKYRKDTERGAMQLQLFQQKVDEYLASQAPKQGTRVRLVRDYRRDANARHQGSRMDPRAWP